MKLHVHVYIHVHIVFIHIIKVITCTYVHVINYIYMCTHSIHNKCIYMNMCTCN